MKKHLPTFALLIALMAPAWAGTQTATLSVPTMDCPVCPITVRKALTNVPGVGGAKVDFERREVVVTFDPAKTSVEALTNATRDAGYPSIVTKAGQ